MGDGTSVRIVRRRDVGVRVRWGERLGGRGGVNIVSSPAKSSSHHFPPIASSPPFITALASSMVSARRRSWPEMKGPLVGSPVHVEISMMSRAWLRRLRSVES